MANKEVKSNLEMENLIETKGFKPGEKVFSVEQMQIAVMPKKFAKVSGEVGNTRKIGIIVLSLGAIFLIAIFVFSYWYFFQYEPKQEQEEKNSLNILDDDLLALEKRENSKKTDSKNVEDNIPVKKENGLYDDVEEKASIEKKNEKAEKEEELEEKTKASSSVKKVIAKTVSSSTEKKVTKIYKEALDSDNDGLSDLEESLLGCSSVLKDSDQDTYEDLSEFLKLYNPSGEGSLMANSNIEEYRNGAYSYKLYYPQRWKITESENGESLIFNINNNSFMQVVVQENKEGLDLEAWFKKQFNTSFIKNSQIIYKKGWLGYRSDDALNVYINRPGKNMIYIISYGVFSGDSLDYQNIFQMMINSFELIK